MTAVEHWGRESTSKTISWMVGLNYTNDELPKFCRCYGRGAAGFPPALFSLVKTVWGACLLPWTPTHLMSKCIVKLGCLRPLQMLSSNDRFGGNPCLWKYPRPNSNQCLLICRSVLAFYFFPKRKHWWTILGDSQHHYFQTNWVCEDCGIFLKKNCQKLQAIYHHHVPLLSPPMYLLSCWKALHKRRQWERRWDSGILQWFILRVTQTFLPAKPPAFQ